METINNNKSVLSTISASSNFWMDDDLWADILKRLPVKTLGRFRCVCKSWYSFISSSLFINLHHSFTSSTTPPNLKPYLLHQHNSTTYTLCHPQQDSFEVRFPFRPVEDFKRMNLAFVDVIHGVVCLSYSLDSAFDSTLLWNPSIHKYAVLPFLPFTPLDLDASAMDAFADANHDTWMDIEFVARFESSTIGFGYDNSKNDFKVVRIWTPDPDLQTLTTLFSPKYEVYSAQQGLWRAVSITDVNIFHLDYRRGTAVTGCFVNGTIHWLSSYVWVLMFDCEREDFKIMELPKGFIRPAHLICRRAELLEHAGMLSALVSTHLMGGGVCIELWAMEEHGVATSWRKLYSIHDGVELSGIRSYRPSFGKLTPYGPNQWSHWTKSRSTDDKFKRILSGHVYEESLFLMDHDKAHSYTKEEIISYKDFISKDI